jgi:hypothetical protein
MKILFINKTFLKILKIKLPLTQKYMTNLLSINILYLEVLNLYINQEFIKTNNIMIYKLIGNFKKSIFITELYISLITINSNN